MKKDFSREFWALIGTGLILCAFLIGWNFFSTAGVTVFVVTEETSAGTIVEEIGAHPTQLESETPAEKSRRFPESATRRTRRSGI